MITKEYIFRCINIIENFEYVEFNLYVFFKYQTKQISLK